MGVTRENSPGGISSADRVGLDASWASVQVGHCCVVSGGRLCVTQQRYNTTSSSYHVELVEGSTLVESEEPMGEATPPKERTAAQMAREAEVAVLKQEDDRSRSLAKQAVI